MPEGITIVPPLPHDAMADAMDGTSSIDDDPPALGVHVDARELRMRVASGKASVSGSVASRVNKFDMNIDIVAQLMKFKFSQEFK